MRDIGLYLKMVNSVDVWKMDIFWQWIFFDNGYWQSIFLDTCFIFGQLLCGTLTLVGAHRCRRNERRHRKERDWNPRTRGFRLGPCTRDWWVIRLFRIFDRVITNTFVPKYIQTDVNIFNLFSKNICSATSLASGRIWATQIPETTKERHGGV